MKFRSALRAASLCPLLALVCSSCSKSPEPPTVTRAETPAPTPASSPKDLADVASDKIKHKADKAIKALSGFLKSEDPRLQGKLEKFTDKIAHDKDGWRKKLEQKRDELRPQIDQLKEQVAKAEGKSKDDVDRQLATLEAQSQNAEKKLSQLEGASGDTWKKIKAQLKEAEAKGDVTRDDGKTDADMPPTPSPTP